MLLRRANKQTSDPHLKVEARRRHPRAGGKALPAGVFVDTHLHVQASGVGEAGTGRGEPQCRPRPRSHIRAHGCGTGSSRGWDSASDITALPLSPQPCHLVMAAATAGGRGRQGRERRPALLLWGQPRTAAPLPASPRTPVMGGGAGGGTCEGQEIGAKEVLNWTVIEIMILESE